MRKLLTLTLVRNEDKILLGLKKRGFGVGRYNGFGGKVEDGETIEEGALRELHEESGLQAASLHKVGILAFEFLDKPDEVLETHIFPCTTYTGEIGESEEMKPEWFNSTDIPFAQMWKDDIFWFPLFLQNKKFAGRFVFDANDEIVFSELREVENLE